MTISNFSKTANNNATTAFLNTENAENEVRQIIHNAKNTIAHYSGNPINLIYGLSDPSLQEKEPHAIYTNDLEALEKYKWCLGNLCHVTLSLLNNKFTILIGLEDYFNSLPLSKDNLASLSQSFLNTLKTISPYFHLLKGSQLALTGQDTLPKPIHEEFVHKHNIRNVLISEPYQTGNMYWFNMFEQSEEFNFDHPSDHIQGMLIMEGLRQASIATVHLAGLPCEGGSLALLSFDTNFSSYVEAGYPILIRSFAYLVAPENGGKENLTFVVSQIFQKGKICAEAILTGHTFWSREEYASVRNRTRSIIERQQKLFEKKVLTIN